MYPENALSQDGNRPSHGQQPLAENGLLEKVRASFPDLSGRAVDAKAAKSAIQNALLSLTEPDQLVELRILGVNGKKRTDSGYFSDPEKLANAAVRYDGRAEGLYFTLNPVQPALVARANQRVKEYADHTTSDADIQKRITLPIDFDVVRPAGISSSDAEHHQALERAWLCRTWLTTQGWPDPTFADSGNGAHLLYVVDLPNDAASTDLIKSCLLALSALFSDAQVKVDTSTSNASRIFKLYGTLACKGDPTPDRPHRRAAIISTPITRQVVSQAQLEALAARKPPSSKPAVQPASPAAQSNHGRYGKAALEQELARLAAAQSGNRNNQLFQSAAALFSLVAAGALERSEVEQALLSTAQTIGLADQEAQRTLHSAAERGLSQPRILPPPTATPDVDQPLDIRQAVPAAPLKPLMSTSQTPPTEPPKAADLLMHVDELDDLLPIRWLIQDYLPEDSLVEVYGAPSAGKTQVVFDMAQTLATAGKTVIYVVAEGLRGFRSRKKAWQKFRKQAGGNLYIWREPVQLFDASSVRQFIDTVTPK